jgi:hypothetical protein
VSALKKYIRQATVFPGGRKPVRFLKMVSKAQIAVKGKLPSDKMRNVFDPVEPFYRRLP